MRKLFFSQKCEIIFVEMRKWLSRICESENICFNPSCSSAKSPPWRPGRDSKPGTYVRVHILRQAGGLTIQLRYTKIHRNNAAFTFIVYHFLTLTVLFIIYLLPLPASLPPPPSVSLTSISGTVQSITIFALTRNSFRSLTMRQD